MRAKILILLVLAVCLITPCSAKSLKDVLIGLEIGLGQMIGSALEEEFSLSDNPALNAKVNNVGLKLAQTEYAKRKGINYQFKVLATSEINAFAAPGGFVYVTEGLLRNFGPSPDEIAFVIAHEIAHVREQHGTKRLLPLIILGQLTEGDTVKEIIGQLLISGRSRKDEKEADEKGVKLAQRAGFDPAGALASMRRLETLNKKEPDILERLFATHPPTSERSETIKDFLIKSVTGFDHKTLAAESLATSDSFIKPTDTFQLSNERFGSPWFNCPCKIPKKHVGVDVDMDQIGKKVVAAGLGLIRYAGSFGKGWGNCVIIEHNVSKIGPVTTLYGHIIISPEIKSGVMVSKGQILGTIDPKIKPPHLHFGVRLHSYDRYSIRGAGAVCNNTKNPYCQPKFPEYFVDPIKFLEEHGQPKPQPKPHNKILLEKGPVHIGDDREDVKTIWLREFELNPADLENRTEAKIKLRVRATENKDPMLSINRVCVYQVVVREDKWQWFEFPVSLKLLRPGKNLIDIETVIPNLFETFDDCEFADVYLLLK